jgi:hypothetical protein
VRYATSAIAMGMLMVLGAATATAQERGFKRPKEPVTLGRASESRVALVIGNGDYDESPLRNPVRDAHSMASTLRSLGFAVEEHTNADQKTMKLAIRALGEAQGANTVALFYFAGHGMQVNGRNYLIPVGADIEVADDVEIEGVDVAYVLGRMGAAENRMNIVILDACRNNPFASNTRSMNRGLAFTAAPTGTVIAYATAPGQVAEDGTGENGVYTEALVRHLQREGLQAEDVFKSVRADVQAVTGGRQVPWESSSLTGHFYFAGGEGSQAAPVTTTIIMPSNDTSWSTMEWLGWGSIGVGTAALAGGVGFYYAAGKRASDYDKFTAQGETALADEAKALTEDNRLYSNALYWTGGVVVGAGLFFLVFDAVYGVTDPATTTAWGISPWERGVLVQGAF